MYKHSVTPFYPAFRNNLRVSLYPVVLIKKNVIEFQTMTSLSLKEIVQIGIDLEEANLRIFDGVIKSGRSNAVKKVIEFIFTDELRHKDMYERLMDDVIKESEGKNEGTKTASYEFGKFVPNLSQAGVNETVNKIKRSGDLFEIFDLCIDSEEKALHFFLAAGNLIKGEARNVFNIIANEEKDHLKKLFHARGLVKKEAQKKSGKPVK
jgi:rubrerythrin